MIPSVPIKKILYLPNGVLQLFVEHESFSFRFFIFFMSEGLGTGKGK